MKTSKQSQSGFTLIELMIVVAIIGILAAIAIPQFLKYMQNSKATEAKLQLHAVGLDAKSYWVEHTQFPAGSGPQTPTKPGTGGCCGTPSNKCAPAVWGGAWVDLGFEIKEATLFYYQYDGTSTAFTATATGDLNCNGREAVYTLVGDSAGGTPFLTLTEPAANAE